MQRIFFLTSVIFVAGLACNFSPVAQTVETEEPAVTEELVLTEAVVLTEELVVTEEPVVPTDTPAALPSPTLPPPTSAPTATSPPPTSIPTATEVEVEWPLIEQGSCGSRVRAAQLLLRDHGYIPIIVDGVFGPQTDNRVKSFQSDEGLVSDGIVGPLTWRELVKVGLVQQGDTGPEVRAVQTMLRAHGYDDVDVDGIFGPITRTAVTDFQTNNDLLVDGIVGPETWKWLISLPFQELIAC